jgi:hypothetical protein
MLFTISLSGRLYILSVHLLALLCNFLCCNLHRDDNTNDTRRMKTPDTGLPLAPCAQQYNKTSCLPLSFVPEDTFSFNYFKSHYSTDAHRIANLPESKT